jgi:two-component system chemotaxis response regulator CheB
MKPENTAPKIRVLVVDDSAFVRASVSKMLATSRYLEVVGVAADGEDALAKVKKLRPDIVTLDIRMPVLDGLSALQRIMEQCPTPVVMLSSLTGHGGEMTLKALELGAVDFIDKSTTTGPMELAALTDELICKVIVASRVDVTKFNIERKGKAAVRPDVQAASLKGDVELVVIGTSTGGPQALHHIVAKLPSPLPWPMAIVQHMPVGFTKSLAERLDKIGDIPVKEAEDGEYMQPGTIYVARAGIHLKVKRDKKGLKVELDTLPAESLHRPSVDELFLSAAAACGHKVTGFVLTGMGRDGVVGARAIKDVGGRIVVESEESSIVFGMPRAVIEEVPVDGVLPLDKISATIAALAGS